MEKTFPLAFIYSTINDVRNPVPNSIKEVLETIVLCDPSQQQRDLKPGDRILFTPSNPSMPRELHTYVDDNGYGMGVGSMTLAYSRCCKIIAADEYCYGVPRLYYPGLNEDFESLTVEVDEKDKVVVNRATGHINIIKANYNETKLIRDVYCKLFGLTYKEAYVNDLNQPCEAALYLNGEWFINANDLVDKEELEKLILEYSIKLKI